MKTITQEMIKEQQLVVNTIDHKADFKAFEIQFDILSDMRAAYSEANPVQLPTNWGEGYFA